MELDRGKLNEMSGNAKREYKRRMTELGDWAGSREEIRDKADGFHDGYQEGWEAALDSLPPEPREEGID